MCGGGGGGAKGGGRRGWQSVSQWLGCAPPACPASERARSLPAVAVRHLPRLLVVDVHHSHGVIRCLRRRVRSCARAGERVAQEAGLSGRKTCMHAGRAGGRAVGVTAAHGRSVRSCVHATPPGYAPAWHRPGKRHSSPGCPTACEGGKGQWQEGAGWAAARVRVGRRDWATTASAPARHALCPRTPSHPRAPSHPPTQDSRLDELEVSWPGGVVGGDGEHDVGLLGAQALWVGGLWGGCT